MGRMVIWFGVGLLSIMLIGCEDPPNKINGPAGGGGGGGGGGAAPAAPVAGPAMPMPMPGAGMPMGGHAGGGGDASAAAAPQVVVPPARDPLVFLPATLTFAVGGRPAAATTGKNKVAASLLEQFGPLTNTLAKIGVPPQEFESFWAGGNQDMSEQGVCVVTKSDINVQALRQAVQADKAPAESKVWPLPGPAGATHAIVLADARTIIVGRRATVDAALRKTPSTIVKLGLAAVNSPEADFWIAGDAVAAQSYLKGGFPLIGIYPHPIEGLSGFGVALTLEGRPQPISPGAGSANGAMSPGAMVPAGAMHGAASPMPMGPAMHNGSPNPMGMHNVAPPLSMGPMGPMGQMAASAPPPSGPPPGDPIGVMVVVAMTFESEPGASTVHGPLEMFLSGSSRRFAPRQPRHIPDLSQGPGNVGNGNGAGAAYPMGPMGAMGAMAPMGPMSPGGAGHRGPGGVSSGAGGGSQDGPKVAVVLDTKSPGLPPPLDPRLMPLAPPQPAAAQTNPAGSAGGVDGPMSSAPPPPGMGPPGMAPLAMAPMGPMAPMHSGPMHSAPLQISTNMSGPGMAGSAGYGSGGYGGVVPSATWVHQQGPLLHFAYRYDARDENVALAGHLMRALGIASNGSALAAGPLADLYRATEELRAKGLDEARKAKNGFGTNGSGWMVHLLPHLGHAALYQKFNFGKPLTADPNASLTHVVIPQFLNPADSRQQWQGVPYSGMGLSHFAGVSGIEDSPGPAAAALDRKDPKAGIFGYNDIATPEMITDGQSNTMMLIGSGQMASPWAVGGGSTIRGVRPGSFNPQTGFGSIGGPKPGAFVLFADGSVRFVSADIDEKVLQSLSTTHGAETVDLPALQGSGSVLEKW